MKVWISDLIWVRFHPQVFGRWVHLKIPHTHTHTLPRTRFFPLDSPWHTLTHTHSLQCSRFLSGSSIHLSSHADLCPSTFFPSSVTFQNQGALYIWKTNFFYWINSSKLPRSPLTTTGGAEEGDTNVERAWKASITNFLPFYGHFTQSYNFNLL